MIDLKTAVHVAKEYVADVYAEEDVTAIGLEEVRYDDTEKAWQVTIGFQTATSAGGVLGLDAFQRQMFGSRKYKVVTLNEDGQVKRLTDRFIEVVDG